MSPLDTVRSPPLDTLTVIKMSIRLTPTICDAGLQPAAASSSLEAKLSKLLCKIEFDARMDFYTPQGMRVRLHELDLQMLSSPEVDGSCVSTVPSPPRVLMWEELVTSVDEMMVCMGHTDSDLHLQHTLHNTPCTNTSRR